MSFLGFETRALQKEVDDYRKRQQPRPSTQSRGQPVEKEAPVTPVTPASATEEKSDLEKSLEEDPLTFCGKIIQGTTLKADNEKALDNLKELTRIFGDEKAIDPFEQAFLKDDMFIEMERQRDRVIAGG
jgi:hypothetical protein